MNIFKMMLIASLIIMSGSVHAYYYEGPDYSGSSTDYRKEIREKFEQDAIDTKERLLEKRIRDIETDIINRNMRDNFKR